MPLTTIIFDAGDTLIALNSDDTRPMVEWDVLEAVPGVKDALERLYGSYRLAVASNADVSDGPMLAAALARLGMRQYFLEFFSSVDLGVRKPDPAFFKVVEKTMGVLPGELVMIGDNYNNDVLGAVQSGWRAIWFNPSGQAAPGLAPRCDAEISRLVDLPDALQQLNLPTVDQAYRWLTDQNGQGHLLTHVEMVAALAYQMAVWLRQAGEKVNPVLSHRGGLLHDLAKVPARHQNLDHGRLGAEMLQERNQLALAEIADRHVLFSLLDDQRLPTTWEEKLVYFADKLVEMGHIVSFHERLAAMQQRYQISMASEEWERFVSAITVLELEICKPLAWEPAELLKNLKSAYVATH